ncbi:MAG: YbaK/EbsC family protein [Candidatus Promineifilaceae bacterium]|nr:YbaK/EbsC family protein [Candidatus Promineifilaceae bacterium]
MSQLSDSAQRVQDVLDAHGITAQVVELPDSTRTAQEAAQAIGCDVAQIVKSLVFKTRDEERSVLILTSGSNRVDVKKVGRAVDETIVKADADFVRDHTGFVIGGVPPVGHLDPPITIIDEDLLQYGEIWAAAGTPFAVFRLTPDELLEIAPGRVLDVS